MLLVAAAVLVVVTRPAGRHPGAHRHASPRPSRSPSCRVPSESPSPVTGSTTSTSRVLSCAGGREPRGLPQPVLYLTRLRPRRAARRPGHGSRAPPSPLGPPACSSQPLARGCPQASTASSTATAPIPYAVLAPGSASARRTRARRRRGPAGRSATPWSLAAQAGVGRDPPRRRRDGAGGGVRRRRRRDAEALRGALPFATAARSSADWPSRPRPGERGARSARLRDPRHRRRPGRPCAGGAAPAPAAAAQPRVPGARPRGGTAAAAARPARRHRRDPRRTAAAGGVGAGADGRSPGHVAPRRRRRRCLPRGRRGPQHHREPPASCDRRHRAGAGLGAARRASPHRRLWTSRPGSTTCRASDRRWRSRSTGSL